MLNTAATCKGQCGLSANDSPAVCVWLRPFSLIITTTPCVFIKLSLISILHCIFYYRKAWRPKTTTSTWRWQVRMDLWSSSKSKGTPPSANWWRHTAKDRWDISLSFSHSDVCTRHEALYSWCNVDEQNSNLD